MDETSWIQQYRGHAITGQCVSCHRVQIGIARQAFRDFLICPLGSNPSCSTTRLLTMHQLPTITTTTKTVHLHQCGDSCCLHSSLLLSSSILLPSFLRKGLIGSTTPVCCVILSCWLVCCGLDPSPPLATSPCIGAAALLLSCCPLLLVSLGSCDPLSVAGFGTKAASAFALSVV